jgi:hypothetical protein
MKTDRLFAFASFPFVLFAGIKRRRIMKNLRLICILLAVPALLLIPFFAMRFTDEVNWTALDFIVMGIMLLTTGLGIELALRIFDAAWTRAVAVVAVLFGFVMVWGTLVHMGG